MSQFEAMPAGFREATPADIANFKDRSKPCATLDEYFARPENPSPSSPVAHVMWQLFKRFPETSFDQLRSQARELLWDASKRRNLRVVLPQLADDEILVEPLESSSTALQSS